MEKTQSTTTQGNLFYQPEANRANSTSANTKTSEPYSKLTTKKQSTITPSKRKKTEKELKESWEKLVKDVLRLNDLLENGNAACSKYDLSMGYDAKFNIHLKQNHVRYNARRIIELEEILNS